MGRINDTTNESLLQLSSVTKILMLEHTCTLPAFVELCLIFVNVNLDVCASDGCVDVSLRLACNGSVCKCQTSGSQCGHQLSLALLLKLGQ